MELDPLPPQPVLDTASLPSVIGQDREQINEPEASAEEKDAKLLDEQMCEQVALLERTPLHKLAQVLPLVLERIRQLATKDSNILHQGSVISRLSFPNTTVDMLRELKIFGGSTSTWQWIDNPSTHKQFVNGNRKDYCRTLCTVETAMLILENAHIQDLLDTGNFVIRSDEIATVLTQRGMWQLKVPPIPETWNKISNKNALMWQQAKFSTKQMTLRINALELSETWPERIDAMQLQSVKKTTMVEEDCRRYLKMWISLLVEEKVRQRVAKGPQYNFDDLNMPWQFDATLGYMTLPVIIWMKKDGPKFNTTSRVPQNHGWSSSDSTWTSREWQGYGTGCPWRQR